MGNFILNTLEIRRFRAFEHLQIERLGRVNLITGKNNVGKTYLLEALQLYARKVSVPTFIWETIRTRDKSKQRLVNAEDMLAALRYLFYGRREIRPGIEPIQIGPINIPEEVLSIAIDWSITEMKNGRLYTRPLQPGDDSTADNLIPCFVVQAGGSTVTYPLDTSISQRILRLNTKEINCIFAPANGLEESQIVELWDGIALTHLEKEVLAALRLIAPGIEDLNFVSAPIFEVGARKPIIKIATIDEPLPLSNLGDGMQRVLGIALALVNAKDGILLIDEFENGLHYSVRSDLWHLIFQIANRLNVQVFATTHSWGCIEAFQKAVQDVPENDGLLIRLESRKGRIVTTLFDERKLGIATREHIEVR